MALPETRLGQIAPERELPFEAGGASVRRATLWGDAWRRLLKNKLAVAGGIGVIALILLAVFADVLMRYSYSRQHLVDHFASPGSRYWWGADSLGRDLYSRVIYGARISISVGVLTQLFATLFGVTVGSISGYFAGQVDNAIMRVVDVVQSIPALFFALLVMTALGKSVPHLIMALSFVSWPVMARLTRAQILSLREKEYIKAARLSGGRSWQIILGHLLPNSMTPIIVAVTFGIPLAIFAEATLSFLGIGVNPPIPSWGQMVGDSVKVMRSYWYLAFFPSIALAVTMLSFTFLGDGIRDALDPRMND
jgi:ABC-type dipeptide/oligopeptide/nickel transport system permease subunit